MNNRIQELADHAMAQVVNERIVNGQRETTWDPKRYNEIFAEMIISECIEAARSEMVDESNPSHKESQEYLTGINDGIADAVVAIKQHFGVDH